MKPYMVDLSLLTPEERRRIAKVEQAVREQHGVDLGTYLVRAAETGEAPPVRRWSPLWCRFQLSLLYRRVRRALTADRS